MSPALAVSTHPSSPEAKDAKLTSTVHLHNQLLSALYANIFRDAPPDVIAPWVLAPDDAAGPNPHAAKGNAVGGAANEAEERLKREVMALSARDRRRIKSLKDANVEAPGLEPRLSGPLAENLNYNQALTVPVTNLDTEASIAEGKGSLAKTNWDLEIKRMYAMPLGAETLEFPARADIQSRIEAKCYEEGVGLTATTPLSNATLQSYAELIETACEMYVKETLEHWISVTRTNGEGMPLTAAFKAQRQKEAEAVERGELARTPAGLLPCEAEVGAHREPLSADELRLSFRLDHDRLPNDPFLAERILGDIDVDMDAYNVATPEDGHHLNGILTNRHPNGIKDAAGDPMVVDSDETGDYGWSGGAQEDRDDLMATLSGLGY